MMRVYVSNDFKGHWPVGTAAAVAAPDEFTARALMDEACLEAGLEGFTGTLRELPLDVPSAVILVDGDY